MRGLYLDELVEGERRRSHRRTITQADVASFVGVTHIDDPLFTDAVFAARAPLGSTLVPGPMVMCCAFGLTEELVFGTVVAALAVTRCEFKAPVLPGDTIHVETTIGSVRPSRSRPGLGVVELHHEVHSDRNGLVVEVSRKMLAGTKAHFVAEGLADDGAAGGEGG